MKNAESIYITAQFKIFGLFLNWPTQFEMGQYMSEWNILSYVASHCVIILAMYVATAKTHATETLLKYEQ